MNLGAATRDIARKLTAAVALAMALYHLYVIIPPLDFISPSLREVFRGPPTDYIFRGIHLLFALVLTFLCFRLKSPTDDELAMLLPEARAEVESRRQGAVAARSRAGGGEHRLGRLHLRLLRLHHRPHHLRRRHGVVGHRPAASR